MDGSDSQTVLPNLTPGVTYKVTVVAVKGQRESEPGADSVTTGNVELTIMINCLYSHCSITFKTTMGCLFINMSDNVCVHVCYSSG